MDRTTVIHPEFSAGRRIIAVSDIHGNLPFFRGLLKQVDYTPQDILVLVGDILEKGQESLALLRYIMELSNTHTVYPVCGNCDGIVWRFFETDEMDAGFFTSYLPQHPECTLRQMAQEGGFDQTEDLPKLRQDLRRVFSAEWAWLKTMSIVLETEHLLFVHGGVPSLEGMEEMNPWRCMKNDDFLDQGFGFDKWVIVGHWPVTLYNGEIPSAAPIILNDRKIASIDGGCVLKMDGQLNALMIPQEDGEDFTWTAWDGLPKVRALDDQRASQDSVNIRWGRAGLELLEEGEELSLCRHMETGRELWILNHYLRHGPKGLWCEDSTDYALPVAKGDTLSLVFPTKQGYLCKKEGVTGWYYGQISDIIG